jgi:hypothetical protein
MLAELFFFFFWQRINILKSNYARKVAETQRNLFFAPPYGRYAAKGFILS